MSRALRVSAPGRLLACALLTCALVACALSAASAHAEPTWKLEQPEPPEPPPGVEPAPAPVGLGSVGDIKFWAPNRGVLITAGDPPTVPKGVWIYNGQGWRELTTECGATEGSIAWAGPQEFWTVSDGRTGQAPVDGKQPLIVDDTLCRFGEGRILESFAAPSYEADSYQQMHTARCLEAGDCWFAGEPLPFPFESAEVGGFQLRWNGSGLKISDYLEEGAGIWDIEAFKGRLYESVELQPPCLQPEETNCDHVTRIVGNPQPLRVSDTDPAEGFQEERKGKKLYAGEELPWALEYLHLSAGTSALWAATGPSSGAAGAQLTVLRFTSEAGGEWTQLLGPESEPDLGRFAGEKVTAIAVEPQTAEQKKTHEEAAWVALTKEGSHSASESATLLHVVRSGTGAVSVHEEVLPAPESGGGRGAAARLACPAAGDCWLVTSAGWLYHLAGEGERTLPEDTGSGFTGLITERPHDQGLPQVPPDAPPPDDSGLIGELPERPTIPTVNKGQEEARVPVALVSEVHSRLVRGTTLELRFHLAAKAHIQLIARRHHRVVAKTPTYTFKAGTHKLLLRLDRRRWPTELHLVEHPLEALPTVSANAGTSETVSTSLAFPVHPRADWLGLP